MSGRAQTESTYTLESILLVHCSSFYKTLKVEFPLFTKYKHTYSWKSTNFFRRDSTVACIEIKKSIYILFRGLQEQREEMEKQFEMILDDKLRQERDSFEARIAKSIARLRGIEEAVEGRPWNQSYGSIHEFQCFLFYFPKKSYM